MRSLIGTHLADGAPDRNNWRVMPADCEFVFGLGALLDRGVDALQHVVLRARLTRPLRARSETATSVPTARPSTNHAR